MQKVYLLLRNNQQTGPHSLEDLVQLGLKPMDLVWVEGKSFGWSYPSEVEALRPYITVAVPQKTEPLPVATEALSAPSPRPAAAPKKIFVSMPVAAVQTSVPLPSSSYDPLEQKAEELRKRAEAYMTQSSYQGTYQGALQEEGLKTNYARSLGDVEEDYASWIYQKKTKKKRDLPVKQLAVAGLLVAGLAGLWWAGKTFFSTPVSSPIRVATQSVINKQEQPLVTEEIRPVPVPSAKAATPQKHSTVSTITKKPKGSRSQKVQLSAQSAATASAPVIAHAEPVAPSRETTIPAGEETKPATIEPAKAKKKTLKEVLGGLFKKKNKDEAQNPRPSGDNGNERTAARRDEATAPTTVNLAEQVDVKTNKSPDDWMMGIQGLKLTLTNRSTVTLDKASVEVLYYSEQNSLLEKKIIYFSNIAPRKSQTMGAPDHRMADHVEYRVLSATGVE